MLFHLNEKVLDGVGNYPRIRCMEGCPTYIKGNKKGDTDAGRQLSLTSITPYYSFVV